MPNIIELTVPDIGDFHEVEIIEIAIKVGDRISKNDSLLTLETDKATMEVPADCSGEIRELRVKVGDKVSQRSIIALLEVVPATEAAAGAPTTPPAVTPSAMAEAAPPVSTALSAEKPAEQAVAASDIDAAAFRAAHASPAVRKFARELGVDLSRIHGTGPKNRIQQSDVQAFVKTALSQTVEHAQPARSGGLDLLPWPKIDFAKFGPVESQPLSRIQKLSGANLARNWAMIPHVTQFDEADISELEAFRKTMTDEMKAEGVRLTPLAFLIKAVVKALQVYPTFNASLDGDTLVLKRYFHIGFAADTPNGLVVPVVRDADQKGLKQLAQETAVLAAKARDGKLGAADMQGGCFSISSLGGIGGTAFTPIINAPEVAILGVSKTQVRPVWKDGQFAPRHMLPLSLSYDHRVIDGAAAARFTALLGKLLGDVRRLML